MFAKDWLAMHVVHIGDSDGDTERSWHIIHGDPCSGLLAMWYRPPCRGETTSIDLLDTELFQPMPGDAFTIIVGDMNVHDREWQQHSSHDTV